MDSEDVEDYEDYVQRGGSFLIMSGAGRADMPDPLAARFGVRFDGNVADGEITRWANSLRDGGPPTVPRR
jgi:hypothetical protein